MKKRTDPRHLRRIKLTQSIFSWSFGKKSPSPTIKPIISHLKKIDDLIGKSAPNRPLMEINRIDLAILRLSVFELIIEKEAPPKVVIDEAIEIGKEFGGESSPAFINGVLGQVVKLKNIKIDSKQKKV